MTRLPFDTSLLPTRAERVARARSELAMGLPCVLADGEELALLVPLETIQAQRFAALRNALGAPQLVISAHRARAVMTRAAATNLGEGSVLISPPEGAQLAWYQRIADPKGDQQAGAIGPLHVVRSGATQLHEAGLALVKSAQLIPAFVVFALAEENPLLGELALLRLQASDVLEALDEAPSLAPVASARLPLEAHDLGRLHVFRDGDGVREHYAIEIGQPDRHQPVLARLHSACFTGDVLGSLKCDCGPQLRASLARMGEEGAGVLLYLNQEGRGIGLANKMRVYDLQSHGFDTVEANHRLGFEDDERDFRIAAVLLQSLGMKAVRLLTNNPGKVDGLEGCGIEVVERLPLQVGRGLHNHGYLAVKALKSGHLL